MGSLRYAKAKGRTAEAKVVEYLRERGFNAERRRLTGCEDCGDLGGIPNLVVEVKDRKTLALGPWMDEADAEATNADARFGGEHLGVVVAKRKGFPDDAASWFAVLSLADLVYLLQKAGYR